MIDLRSCGLQKVAKYYYAPGWWEGSATLDLFVNLKAFNALPADYRAAIEAAGAEANGWMTAKYDVENPAAIAAWSPTGRSCARSPGP
jgi:TRAP-type mannitol/chloroaromatic compound transport system substrate-binding protein